MKKDFCKFYANTLHWFGSLSFFQFLQGLGDDRALLCDRAPPEALFRKAIPPGHTDPVVRAVQHSKVLRAGETGDQQQQQQQCLRCECFLLNTFIEHHTTDYNYNNYLFITY